MIQMCLSRHHSIDKAREHRRCEWGPPILLIYVRAVILPILRRTEMPVIPFVNDFRARNAARSSR